jgi:hypothetical protein
MHISIKGFCVWWGVKHDFDRDWTHYHNFYPFSTFRLIIVKLSCEELNFWTPDHLVALLSTTLFWLLIYWKIFCVSTYMHLGQTMHMLHGHCKHSTCMWNLPCMHPKHAIDMSQTCLTQAAHALHTCRLHAIHRQHTFHIHTFMNAQAYCTTCKNAHTVYAHTMYAWSTQETLTHATLTCITYATYHIHKYAAGMPKTHTVCILHANCMPHMHEFMPHMHACMPHSYCICCMHNIVIHTAHTYSACMHTIPTYAGYFMLHVNFMQNTCKHFPWIHKLMLHSHKPFTCTLHTSTLHPHTMPLASRTCVSLLCTFRMCLCAWQYSCMEHVLVQLLACGKPAGGVQGAVYVHACGWFSCMQCVACMCVWCAFMWHIGMPGRVYSTSALHVAKLSYYIECKISLNYIVHNVKAGKFYTI